MSIACLRTAARVALVAAALVAAGCATPPPATGPSKPEPATTPPAATAASPGATAAVPAPAPVPAPEPAPVDVPPAIAKPQAQKLALEAVDHLQNGDESAAAATIDRALALDATNELARKLAEQIRADAQKELGPVFFRYTVLKDDTLSKLAQQFLGDRFRFYILAKYNDITNPSRLAAGQVIRVPGKAPPAQAAPVAATPEPVPAARPPEAEARPRDDAVEALAKAAQMERSGNLDGAYVAYADIAQRYPANAEAAKRRDATRASLVRALDREATQAFQRQNLDLAIAKWDRVIEVDPANKKARLERERALDLKRKAEKRFGTAK